jgi:hypothetical protein
VHPDRLEDRHRGPARTAAPTDVLTLLGTLSDAIAIVTVAHRSLEARESAHVGDETVALRYALSLLRAAYSGLDLASERARRTSRGAR